MAKNGFIAMLFTMLTLQLAAQCRIDTVYNYRMQQRTVKYVKIIDSRTVKQYDANNNLILEINSYPIYQNYILQKWVENSRNYYTYNANNLLLTSDVYKYNFISPKNYFREKHTYTYNSAKQKTSDLLQWSDTVTWTDINKTEWIYNANTTEQIYTVYKTKTPSIDYTNKKISVYNPDGTINQLEELFWNGSTFKKTQKSDYTYSNSKKLLSRVHWDWDETSSSYYLWYKYTYLYNTNDLVVSMLNWNYDGPTSKWNLSTKDTTFYNSSNKRMGTTKYWYNTSTKNWEIDERDSLSYDQNGNLKFRQIWDARSGTYRPRYQNFYNIFSQNGLTYVNREEYFYYSVDNSWRKNILQNYNYYDPSVYMQYEQYYSWNENIEQYTGVVAYDNICSQRPVLDTRNYAKGIIHIYPNPIITGNNFKIMVDEKQHYKVLDLYGRKIQAGYLISGENNIELSVNISNGAYFVITKLGAQKLVVNR